MISRKLVDQYIEKFKDSPPVIGVPDEEVSSNIRTALKTGKKIISPLKELAEAGVDTKDVVI